MNNKENIIPTIEYSIYSDNYIFINDKYLKNRSIAYYDYVNPKNIYSLDINTTEFPNEDIEKLFSSKLKYFYFARNNYNNLRLYYYINKQKPYNIFILYVEDINKAILEVRDNKNIVQELYKFNIELAFPKKIDIFSKLELLKFKKNILLRDMEEIKIPKDKLLRHFCAYKIER